MADGWCSFEQTDSSSHSLEGSQSNKRSFADTMPRQNPSKGAYIRVTLRTALSLKLCMREKSKNQQQLYMQAIWWNHYRHDKQKMCAAVKAQIASTQRLAYTNVYTICRLLTEA